MSFMVVKCPWCGETYTFGIVGTQQIGTGHICHALLQCAVDGCEEQGRFQVERDGLHFVCADHIGEGVILACQPGNRP